MSLIDKVKAFEEAVEKSWDIQPVLDLLLAMHELMNVKKGRAWNLTLFEREEAFGDKVKYCCYIDSKEESPFHKGTLGGIRKIRTRADGSVCQAVPVTSMEYIAEDMLVAIERILDARIKKAERNDAAMEKIVDMSRYLRERLNER